MVSASLSLEGSRVPTKYEFVTLLAPQTIARPGSYKKSNVQFNLLKSTTQSLSSQV